MAKLTAEQVQGDIYALLRQSSLVAGLSGSVYQEGYRPIDSRAEDAVVIFTAGLADEIETGVVTVHIYVPYIELDGRMVKDGGRVKALESAASLWAEGLSLSGNYLFALQAAVTSDPLPDIEQSRIVVMLEYSHYSG